MGTRLHGNPRLALEEGPRSRSVDDRSDAQPRRARQQLRAARRLLRTLFAGYGGSAAVGLWNGETVVGGPEADTVLVIRDPGVLRHLLLRRDVVSLGEAFLNGDVTVEGRIEGVFELVDYLEFADLSLARRLLLGWGACRMPGGYRPSGATAARARGDRRRNSSAAIGHHYDVSNAFYRLWLDPEMVYSCAYFRDQDQSLEQAQRDKLDYICRKLRLAPGQRLLDIGCGWGGLLRWAAKHYGVTAHGITLSRQQYDYARQRIEQEQLGNRVRVELRDYRHLSPEILYDRIVSVGMFEHVGLANFGAYFGAVKRLLKPGGLFLNHGITNDTGWKATPIQRFVNRYVFPDGELTRMSEVASAMEQVGFEVFDVENLRPHYALTCRHWVRALEDQVAAARRLVDEVTYRVWRLYLAGAGYYFQQGSLKVYQILAGLERSPLAVPLRREDLYR